MKNRLLLTICVLGSCILFGCVKDLKKAGISETTTLVGKILEESEREPIPQVKVMVTNGETVYLNTTTNANGEFSMDVDFGRIDKNSFVFIKLEGDYSEITKRLELKGMGKESYNYENIFLYNKVNDVVPTVTTKSITNIESNSADGGGNVTNDGGSEVSDRGICWSLTPNPTISDRTANGGEGLGAFNCHMSDLAPNTKYYVRAYAVNLSGVAYGPSKSFTTKQESNLPKVETNMPTDVLSNSAQCHGEVTSDGGATIERRGFCWGTSENPTINSNTTVDAETNGVGSFSCTITGLSPNTTYHVRAFAVNSKGTAYGSDKTFKTNLANISDWLYYGDDSSITCWGLTNGGDDEWAVMFPKSNLSPYSGTKITKVRVYIEEVGRYTMKFYEGGTSEPSSLKKTINYNIESSGWWNLLVEPGYDLNTSSNLWISISFSYEAGLYPRSAASGINNPNARWAKANNGSWHDASEFNGGTDLSWAIQAYVTNGDEKGERGGEFMLPSSITANGNGSSVLRLKDADATTARGVTTTKKAKP